MKQYTKTLLRQMKSGLGRVIAIIAIAALGVGFLLGILSATPDMKYTADKYLDDSDMYDVLLKFGAPVDGRIIEQIKQTAGVDRVQPFFQLDCTASSGTESLLAVRICTDSFTSGSVAALTLVSGRMPERAGECAVLEAAGERTAPAEGTSITVNDPPQALTESELCVVGTVRSPVYFTSEREVAAAGDGTLDCVAYITETGAAAQLYTDCAVTGGTTKELNSFIDEYNDAVQSLTKALAERVPAGTYILTRAENASCAGFSVNVDKVEDIAAIFPFFFFIVAALVSVCSMSRMVEEERIQIGTLKALGYSKGRIASKYIWYCLLCGLTGCALGILLGFWMLPLVLYRIYTVTYALPALIICFNWQFALISCSAELIVILLSTLYSLRSSLRESPAALMQQRVPKAGKRILLEHIGPLWRRLPFGYKATARNVFRYKKHLFMSIIGIAGATALILCALGLRDSISGVAEAQYERIFAYDMQISLADSDAGYRPDKCSSIEIYTVSCDMVSGEDRAAASLICATDELAPDYIGLYERRTGEQLSLDGQGIIICAKAANEYGIAVSDTVKIVLPEGERSFIVSGICENYIGNYIYMPCGVYEQSYGTLKPNALLAVTDGIDAASAAKEALSAPAAGTVTLKQDTRAAYERISDSMVYVVAVIIAAAVGLGAIVLYNLTNINICERTKELAALRVLGYHRREVASYVYRESFILSLLGCAAGLLCGYFLHMFVISRAESTELAFMHAVQPSSYLWAFLATMLFTALIDLLMIPKLRSIKMSESMKSTD